MTLMRQVVEDGIEQKVFRKLSPEIVSEAFLGSITGMLEAMFTTGEFYRAEAVAPTLMDLFLGGLRSGSEA